MHDFSNLLSNAAYKRPNRTLALRRLSKAVEGSADYGLHLDCDPFYGRVQLCRNDVDDLEAIVASLGLPDDYRNRLDYTDRGTAHALLDFLLDPEVGVAGTMHEINLIEAGYRSA